MLCLTSEVILSKVYTTFPSSNRTITAPRFDKGWSTIDVN